MDYIFALRSFLIAYNTIPFNQNTPGESMHARTFLEALCFELSIKAYYQMDNRVKPSNTHNLLELFEKLNEETKGFIQKKFDDIIISQKENIEKITGEKMFEISLKGVLEHNSHLIVNFRYEGKLNNGAVIGSNEFINALHSDIEQRIEK